MDQVEVAGLRIAYERVGQGPPLVLLHGHVGDSRTWRGQINALADEFTVIAWDAPGSGRSSDPPESFGMAGFADCLARFVEALGFARAHVGGLSFGGALAIELYRRHPSIPMTLVLASAYAGWVGSLPPEVVEQRLRQALELAGLPPAELVRAVVPTLFSESAAPEMVEEFAATVAEFHPAGLRAMARCAATDLRDVLPRIDVPVLVVCGDKDVRAPLEVAAGLHHAIPGSRLVVLSGVGHACNIEDAERFNREVRRSLRANQR